jgi:hypothetical protein
MNTLVANLPLAPLALTFNHSTMAEPLAMAGIAGCSRTYNLLKQKRNP